MKHGTVIAWRDVVGEVSICENDWNVVRDPVEAKIVLREHGGE